MAPAPALQEIGAAVTLAFLCAALGVRSGTTFVLGLPLVWGCTRARLVDLSLQQWVRALVVGPLQTKQCAAAVIQALVRGTVSRRQTRRYLEQELTGGADAPGSPGSPRRGKVNKQPEKSVGMLGKNSPVGRFKEQRDKLLQIRKARNIPEAGKAGSPLRPQNISAPQLMQNRILGRTILVTTSRVGDSPTTPDRYSQRA